MLLHLIISVVSKSKFLWTRPHIFIYRFTKMDSAGYSGNGEEGVGGTQRNPQNQASQKRLQQTQAKVDEVHFKP
jgi:hypothetical protein